jgi:hypothetical protein
MTARVILPAPARALFGSMNSQARSGRPPRRLARRGRSRTECDCGRARYATRAGARSLWSNATHHEYNYALAMSGNVRIERGWIFVDGTRQDDGTIKLGTGREMRFSPFEAISQRHDAQITWGQILTASVQRLAFWRR